MAEINTEQDSLRLSVSLPAYSDINGFVKANAWEVTADYERKTADSRGYIINNGLGNPATIDLVSPEKEGPLAYDIRPMLTLENEDILPKDGFATVGCDDGRNFFFRSTDIPEQGKVVIAAFSLAQVEMRELPEGIAPTMGNIGVDAPLKDFAEHAKEMNVFDREGNLLLSSPIEMSYEPDIRLERNIETNTIPFGIDFDRDVEDIDIADTEDERGL
jgi:hypothetical protein